MNPSGTRGLAAAAGALLMLEAIAAWCSSPQTLRVNPERAKTLFTWVHLGLGAGAVLVAMAMVMDPRNAKAIATGATVAGGTLYLGYWYAKRQGEQDNSSPTENYTVRG